MSGLYVFYPLNDMIQCPLSLVRWPGHVPSYELPDIVLPLLRAGQTVEVKRLGAKIWGVEKQEPQQ